MRALYSLMVLAAGCSEPDESAQIKARYNELDAQISDACGTFHTSIPAIRCAPPAVDVTPISMCLTTHLAERSPARADGTAGVYGDQFEMGRLVYTSDTHLFVVDGEVIEFHHAPAHTFYSDFGDPYDYEESWTERRCTGISLASSTSNCPDVVATGCDDLPVP